MSEFIPSNDAEASDNSLPLASPGNDKLTYAQLTALECKAMQEFEQILSSVEPKITFQLLDIGGTEDEHEGLLAAGFVNDYHVMHAIVAIDKVDSKISREIIVTSIGEIDFVDSYRYALERDEEVGDQPFGVYEIERYTQIHRLVESYNRLFLTADKIKHAPSVLSPSAEYLTWQNYKQKGIDYLGKEKPFDISCRMRLNLDGSKTHRQSFVDAMHFIVGTMEILEPQYDDLKKECGAVNAWKLKL